MASVIRNRFGSRPVVREADKTTSHLVSPLPLARGVTGEGPDGHSFLKIVGFGLALARIRGVKLHLVNWLESSQDHNGMASAVVALGVYPGPGHQPPK
jgi:hypothetical protein